MTNATNQNNIQIAEQQLAELLQAVDGIYKTIEQNTADAVASVDVIEQSVDHTIEKNETIATELENIELVTGDQIDELMMEFIDETTDDEEKTDSPL